MKKTWYKAAKVELTRNEAGKLRIGIKVVGPDGNLLYLTSSDPAFGTPAEQVERHLADAEKRWNETKNAAPEE
jgi:hypothetical protein